MFGISSGASQQIVLKISSSRCMEMTPCLMFLLSVHAWPSWTLSLPLAKFLKGVFVIHQQVNQHLEQSL